MRQHPHPRFSDSLSLVTRPDHTFQWRLWRGRLAQPCPLTTASPVVSFPAPWLTINPHEIALRIPRLLACFRAEFESERSGDLFGCAFECSFLNFPATHTGWNDHAALPCNLKHFRDFCDRSVERCMWGLRRAVAVGNQSSPGVRCVSTLDRPGAW